VRIEGREFKRVRPASQHRIIYKLRELLGVEEMGGTMRLGAVDMHFAGGVAGRESLRGDHGDQPSGTGTGMNSTAITKRCSPAAGCD